MTPRHLHDHHGELVPVLTGELEEHIVADVAWAAACYIDWTGDQAFATGPAVSELDRVVKRARALAGSFEGHEDS